jgi:hypothetical protein
MKKAKYFIFIFLLFLVFIGDYFSSRIHELSLPSKEIAKIKLMTKFIKDLNLQCKKNKQYEYYPKHIVITTQHNGNDIFVDGKLAKATGALSIFTELNEKHPYNGQFIFVGINNDGTPKKVDSSVPIIADFSESQENCFVSIGLANGNVITSNKLDIKQGNITLDFLEKFLSKENNEIINPKNNINSLITRTAP